MGEEEKYLFDLVKSTINSVYSEERFLLKYQAEDRAGVEQSFAFRVGIYLHELLKETNYKELDLDSEYNKSHGTLKVTPNFPHGIRPDLIIHKRDTHTHNKMAIEFKGWWDNDINKDLQKLADLTSPEGNYKYVIGVFVCIGKDKPEYKLFQGGNEINE